MIEESNVLNSEKNNNSNNTFFEPSELTKTYFNSISQEIIKKVYDNFKPDFEMFNYTIDTII